MNAEASAIDLGIVDVVEAADVGFLVHRFALSDHDLPLAEPIAPILWPLANDQYHLNQRGAQCLVIAGKHA